MLQSLIINYTDCPATQAVADFLSEYLDDNCDYIVAHTSGSTGTPKEIHLLKSDMQQSARNTNEFFGINADSVLGLCLSPNYIAGKMVIVRALEAGAKLYVEQPSNSPLEDYSGTPIDLLSVVPSQMSGLFNAPDRLQYVKRFLVGGGAVSDNLRRKIVGYSLDVYESYGMTETCSHVALAHIEEDKSAFKLLGATIAETDERECLKLTLPQYCIGTLQTNDIVNLLSNKEFYWLGRFDNVVNSGGIKIFPEQVEPAIASVLNKAKFFVCGVPDEKWGEALTLVLEYPSLAPNTFKRGELQPALVEKLKAKLPSTHIPRQYIAIPKIPVTDSQKIIRRLPEYVVI